MLTNRSCGSQRCGKSPYASFAAEDASYIHPDTLPYYCRTNETLLPADVRPKGIVLEFPGLDGNSCLGGSMNELTPYVTPFTQRCAEHGIIAAYLFPGPWSWMNRGAVRLTDLVVDALIEKYGFDMKDPVRLAVTGGSMGGQSALIYTMDSRHAVDACAAHCPCCDVPACFDAHPEFPRTFL